MDRRLLLLCLGVLPLLACRDTDDRMGVPSRVLDLDFSEQTHGWRHGFSDFAPDMAEGMALEAGHAPLPEGIDRQGRALFIAGTNHSDDVFMFWSGRVDGLEPNETYTVQFQVEFATEAPSGCVGIGGPPGESVYVKVGATDREPEARLETVGGMPYFQMNIDKGNQAMGGEDAFVIGDVGNTNTDCLEPVWQLKTLEGNGSFEVTADDEGSLWILVGTDSGFEGRTQLYYTRFYASFQPL